MSTANRNDPCPCGSGKKYKKCCMGKSSVNPGFLLQAAKPTGHDLNATNVESPSDMLMKAVTLHQSGRLDEARTIYQELLRMNPRDCHALHYLGLIALQQENYANAANLIREAIKLDRRVPAFHCNLGNAYKGLGQIDSAIAAYVEAVRLDPNFQAAHNNLGNIYLEQGRQAEGISSHRRAMLMKAEALHQSGRLDEARAIYQELLQKNPADTLSLHNLGLLALQQENHADAAKLIAMAIRLDSSVPEFHCNLGSAYKGLGQIDSAIAAYLESARLNPNFAGVHNNLGNIYLEQGRLEEGIASYRRAIACQPDFAEVRWQLAMTKIQMVADSAQEIADSRTGFLKELEELDAWFDTHMALGHRAVGVYQPFYLAYHEDNNRAILSRYGTLCARLMKYWQDEQNLPPGSGGSQGPVVRVGVVSAYIRNHSCWNAIVKGWVQHLDRSRIELHLLHTGTIQDDVTAWAKDQSNSFEQGNKSLRQWVDTIMSKQLDVLIYPEISMDQMTAKLASLRLAPVQVASWGHPQTTGLPTMDYFLSAESLEPPTAQDHYVEKLVLLPNLGVSYRPPQVASIEPDWAALGIDRGRPILLCPGVPFKYVPQHDQVFVDIAKKLGNCQFVFFTHTMEVLSSKLHLRLQRVFAEAGMDFNNHGVFIPWQRKDAFYGLMQRADVFLDTIGFSGFNTALQALECGLPLVTKEGEFMRGRLASGILRRMGVTELIAASDEEYVNLVIRLVQDKEFRQRIKSGIEASRAVLFDDATPIRSLEDFLIEVSNKSTATTPG